MPAAWFINGGTIGNINEADFLNSIAKRAEVGDWLMISMDTIPEDAATPGGRERFFTTQLDHKCHLSLGVPAERPENRRARVVRVRAGAARSGDCTVDPDAMSSAGVVGATEAR